MEILTLPISTISINGGTQSRVELNESTVAEYAELIRQSIELPPIVVFEDGVNIWVADGFHRFHAHRAAGAMEITCNVRQGTKRDAILYSVGANASHGLRRTNEDKRKAVMTLLNDAEWTKWSANDIAKQCGVSHTYVNGIKSSLESVSSEDSSERVYTTKHGTQATMNTANIGKAKTLPASVNDESPKSAPVALIEAKQAETKAEYPISEIDALKEQIEELASSLKETLADNEMMGRVFDAEDRLKAAMDEAKRQKAVADSAERQFNAQQGKVVALSEQVTYWKNKATKAEKLLKVAA